MVTKLRVPLCAIVVHYGAMPCIFLPLLTITYIDLTEQVHVECVDRSKLAKCISRSPIDGDIEVCCKSMHNSLLASGSQLDHVSHWRIDMLWHGLQSLQALYRLCIAFLRRVSVMLHWRFGFDIKILQSHLLHCISKDKLFEFVEGDLERFGFDIGAFAHYGHHHTPPVIHLTYTYLESLEINYINFVYVVLKLVM
jgi:hypothetical protein